MTKPNSGASSGAGSGARGSGGTPPAPLPAASHPTVLFADMGQGMAQTMKVVLRDAGFPNPRFVETVEDVRFALQTEALDLLIVNATLKDGPGSPLVRVVRDGGLGTDPFLPIITMIENPTPEGIRALVDDGPDAILVKPFSAKALSERIERIVKERKPFVVTRDYFGPDRRAKPREDSKAAPMFQVPNALKRKAEGKLTQEAFEAAVHDARAQIATARLKAWAGGILFQTARVLPALAEGRVGADERSGLTEIVGLAVQARAGTTDPAQAERFGAIGMLAAAIAKGEGGVPAADIAEMQKLANAIRKDFRL